MESVKVSQSKSARASFACAVLSASLLSVACGGEAATSKGAVSPAEQPQAASGVPATTPAGQQFAIPDASTSADTAAANRPKMSASAQSAYNAGMDAFKNGDLQGAKNQFTQATQADPKAYQAFYSLGVVKERLNETSGALTSYRQATTVVADYEPAIVAYAVLLARTGKPDDALDFLNQRQAQMNKSAAVTAAMAEVKSIQGNSGEAQRLAQEALKLNPDYRPAMITLARDHYRSRRLDLALYALKGILDGYGDENPPRDKNNAEAHLLRGLIYKEQGLRAPAIQELQKALDLRPDLVEARVQLSSYYLEAGNAADAQKMLEPALKYDSDNVIAHLNLGDAYRLLGRPADSKRELEWVKSHDSSIAQVHYDLGLLYLFTDNFPGMTPDQAVDAATDELNQYKKMKPRVAGGTPDDTDELLGRAKTKKALIDSKSADTSAPAATPAPAANAASATPAAAAKPGTAAAAATPPTASSPPAAQFAPAPAGGAKK
ncbi:MAG TPA: tetratricopeptide repeat protein [Polyangiaceae bacterium]|jgi:tetratricopeptide (TPR) repeat protein|nr:tetratricopeptide repeat protein [Polyangiaceae bacterium]